MASILRPRQLSLLHRCVINQMMRNRKISTSKKNSDPTTAAATAPTACETKPTTIKDDNWVSYGFSYTDKQEDTNVHNAIFFFSVSLCLVVGSFIWAYLPDPSMRDWAQREAFLELRRRELAGEPRISPDLVDPSTIILPTEDELSDMEIII